jgi:hypothetical protein
MAKLDPYKELILVLEKLKAVVNSFYDRFQMGEELHPALLSYLREARLALQALYSMETITEETKTDKYEQFYKEFKIIFASLPDFIKDELRKEFEKRAEESAEIS